MVPTNKGKPKYWDRSLSQCHSVHHNTKSTGLGSNPYLYGKKPDSPSRGGRGISTPSSAEIDNKWKYTSIRPHTSTTCTGTYSFYTD